MSFFSSGIFSYLIFSKLISLTFLSSSSGTLIINVCLSLPVYLPCFSYLKIILCCVLDELEPSCNLLNPSSPVSRLESVYSEFLIWQYFNILKISKWLLLKSTCSFPNFYYFVSKIFVLFRWKLFFHLPLWACHILFLLYLLSGHTTHPGHGSKSAGS